MLLNIFLRSMILINNTSFAVASYIQGMQEERETNPWDFLYEKGGETPLDHLTEQIQSLNLHIAIIGIIVIVGILVVKAIRRKK